MTFRLVLCAGLLLGAFVFAEEPAKDALGDPLPVGCVKRFGTARFRSEQHHSCVAWAPDGSSVATATNSSVTLWEPETGKILAILPSRDALGNLQSIDFSPDSKLLAQFEFRSVCIWNLAEQKIAREIALENGDTLKFSHDGTRVGVLYRSHFSMIRVADGATLFSVKPEVSEHDFSALAMSPTRNEFALGDRRGCVFVYDGTSGKLLRSKKQAEQRVRNETGCLAYSSDGELLAMGEHQRIQIWKAATFENLKEIYDDDIDWRNSTGMFLKLRFVDKNASIVTADEYSGIRKFDVASGKQRWHVCRDEGGVTGLAVSPDQNTVAAINRSSYVSVVDVESGKRRFDADGHHDVVTSVALAPDGAVALTGSSDGTLRTWNTTSGASDILFTTPRKRTTNVGQVLKVAFAPDGTSFSGLQYEGVILHFDAQTRAKRKIEWKKQNTYCMAYAPDSKWIAAGAFDSKQSPISIWECASGELKQLYRGHDDMLRDIVFTADGRRLISISDNAVKLWNVARGEAERTWKTTSSFCGAIHPDSSLVAFYSAFEVGLYDLNTGERRLKLKVPRAWIAFPHPSAILFSPDGKWIVTANDTKLCFWKTETGELIRDVQTPSSMSSLSLSKDGTMLLSGHHDCTALLWKLGELLPTTKTP